MKTKTKTYVRFLFSDDSPCKERVVRNRDPKGLQFPKHSVSFFFYDVVESRVQHGDDLVLLKSEPMNTSPMHYRKGKVVDARTLASVLFVKGNVRMWVTPKGNPKSFVLAVCPECAAFTVAVTHHEDDVILESV